MEYTYIIIHVCAYITVKPNSCTRSINCCDNNSTCNMKSISCRKKFEAQVLLINVYKYSI